MLFLLALAAQAAVVVPPETQRLADYAMAVGACERYMSREDLREISRISETGPAEKRRFVEQMRAEGRTMQNEVDRRVCQRLLRR